MNILLVEDNEGDIALTEMAFQRRNLTSRLAVTHNGVEAIDYLARRGKFSDVARPDLVLLDLNMPRMDGRQFLEVVKQDDKLKSIPVVMFTSSQAPKDILECYERHANSYMIKPFNPEEFMDLIKRIECFWTNVVRLPEQKSAAP